MSSRSSGEEGRRSGDGRRRSSGGAREASQGREREVKQAQRASGGDARQQQQQRPQQGERQGSGSRLLQDSRRPSHDERQEAVRRPQNERQYSGPSTQQQQQQDVRRPLNDDRVVAQRPQNERQYSGPAAQQDSRRPENDNRQPPRQDARRPLNDEWAVAQQVKHGQSERSDPRQQINTPVQQYAPDTRAPPPQQRQSPQKQHLPQQRPAIQPVNTYSQSTIPQQPLSPAPVTSIDRRAVPQHVSRNDVSSPSSAYSYSQTPTTQSHAPQQMNHVPQESLGSFYDGYNDHDEQALQPPPTLEQPRSRNSEIEMEMPDFDAAAPGQTSLLMKRIKETEKLEKKGGQVSGKALSRPTSTEVTAVERQRGGVAGPAVQSQAHGGNFEFGLNQPGVGSAYSQMQSDGVVRAPPIQQREYVAPQNAHQQQGQSPAYPQAAGSGYVRSPPPPQQGQYAAPQIQSPGYPPQQQQGRGAAYPPGSAGLVRSPPPPQQSQYGTPQPQSPMYPPGGNGYVRSPPPPQQSQYAAPQPGWNGEQAPPRGSMDDARQMPIRQQGGPPQPQRFYANGQQPPTGAFSPQPQQQQPQYRPDLVSNDSGRTMQSVWSDPGQQPLQQRGPSAPPLRQGLQSPPGGSYSSDQVGVPLTQQRSAPDAALSPTASSQRHASNPDALPHHPAPVRQGLNDKPPPVRNYDSVSMHSASSMSQHNRRVSLEPEVTFAELDRLRASVAANPANHKTALLLVKKLVEASTVLTRADPRNAAKNREKYILEAHKRLKKLVAAGDPAAQFYLADCHGSGSLGLEVDPKEAFTLYQAAAKQGHPQAAYRTAVCCEMGPEEGGGTRRDYAKAVQWYRRAAALGDVAAMYKLGMVLSKGLLAQPRNVAEAVTWLKRAAERASTENPHALHELGTLYEPSNTDPAVRGKIIADEAYARELFTQSATLGYKFSQFRLGQAYEYGHLGLAIDNRASISWYTKAAAQGEHQAELALSGWYLTGAEGILEHSDTEAYLWARKAAMGEGVLPKAWFAMGWFSESGIGCPVDVEEARRWYGRAACECIL